VCVVLVPGIHGGGGEFFGVARTKRCGGLMLECDRVGIFDDGELRGQWRRSSCPRFAD
jgi:hypothetical protein